MVLTERDWLDQAAGREQYIANYYNTPKFCIPRIETAEPTTLSLYVYVCSAWVTLLSEGGGGREGLLGTSGLSLPVLGSRVGESPTLKLTG